MIWAINKASSRLHFYTVIVIVMVQVGVEMGANGACRVSCMLIAWMGALVNGSNVFPSIKDSKLIVLKELLTIDFAWRVASQVHYMGDISLYCRQQGHCTNNRELRMNIPLLFRTKKLFRSFAKYKPWLNTIRMTLVPGAFSQLIHILNELRKNGPFGA